MFKIAFVKLDGVVWDKCHCILSFIIYHLLFVIVCYLVRCACVNNVRTTSLSLSCNYDCD